MIVFFAIEWKKINVTRRRNKVNFIFFLILIISRRMEVSSGKQNKDHDVTKNAEWRVTQTVSEWKEYPRISDQKVGANFGVMACSLVRDLAHPLEHFERELMAEIRSWSPETLLGVFPEYCWRTTTPAEVFECIDRLMEFVPSQLTLVLGTLEFTLNGCFTNNAIVLHDHHLWYVPKLHALDSEISRGLQRGSHTNPRVIRLPRFTLGVVVCADLWNMDLTDRLVKSEKIDVLAVPAWFAVPIGQSDAARQKVHHLAYTQCNRLFVTVVVADHLHHFPTSEVANATGVFSRESEYHEGPDPQTKTIRYFNLCQPEKAALSRQSWIKRGMPW